MNLKEFCKEAPECYPILQDKDIQFGRLLTETISQHKEGEWMLVDLGRLADAVAMHETKYCTDPRSPTANKRNNCWGIMTWKRGFRELKTYKSIDEGKQDFIRIWKKGYGGRLPTLADAKRYSGEDKYLAWYRNVHHFYNS